MISKLNTTASCCLLVFSILLAASCTPKNYEKLPDGVLIHLPGGKDGTAKNLKLQVVTPEIIHVTATPGEAFSNDESLIILKKERPAPAWNLEEAGENLVLKTSYLSATVSPGTGEVVFKDNAGKVILQELPGGGKTFTLVAVGGKPFFAVRQVFESPDDEAFYGLGQHQNGQMNYKGEDVELAQHNIVAVVPFLYSNKNYGLLWDNYSITRFGDPRPFGALSGLQLFSKNGQPGGLTASYFDEKNQVVASRQEQEIGYEYLHSFDGMPENFNMENGKVVWEGSIASDVSGTSSARFARCSAATGSIPSGKFTTPPRPIPPSTIRWFFTTNSATT